MQKSVQLCNVFLNQKVGTFYLDKKLPSDKENKKKTNIDSVKSLYYRPYHINYDSAFCNRW